MDEIRFGQQPRMDHMDRMPGNMPVKNGPGFFVKAMKILFFIVLIAAFVALGFFARNFMQNRGQNIPNVYSAVFISNGQVYFGKIVSKSDSELVLTNVYYLQLSDSSGAQSQQSQLSEPKFTLIKLGNEIHGPTDELYVNTSQILFYENLRDDSKVVQSIKNYK